LHHLPGDFGDVELEDIGDRQLAKETGTGRDLLITTAFAAFYASYSCRFCKTDNKDGRRLNTFDVAAMFEWINAHTQETLDSALSSDVSSTCQASVGMWDAIVIKI